MSYERTKLVIDKWAKDVFDAYKSGLNGSRASGELQDTMSFKITQNGSSFEVVFNMLSYWEYVEYGRPPGGFPYIESIADWIEIKPIIPQPTVLPNGATSIPTPNQLVFLIGRKIAEEGTEGNGVLEKTVDNFREQLLVELRQALKEDVIEVLKVQFGE